MSGYKRTTVTYDAARERRRSLIASMRGNLQSIKQAKGEIRSLLEDIDPMVRQACTNEIKSAEAWLSSNSPNSMGGCTLSSPDSLVNEQSNSIASAAALGQASANALRVAVRSNESTIRKQLLGDVAELQVLSASYKTMFKTHGLQIDWDHTLSSINREASDGHLAAASALLSSTCEELTSTIKKAEEKEHTRQLNAAEGRLSRAQMRAESVKAKLVNAANQVPGALAEAFAADLNRLALGTSTISEAQDTTEPADLKSITALEQELERTTSRAELVYSEIVPPMLERLEGLHQEALTSVDGASGVCEAFDESTLRWQPSESVESIKALAQQAKAAFSSGDYFSAIQLSDKASTEAAVMAENSATLDTLHDQRLYVVQGLWKVLVDMGFKVEEPRLEEPKNLRSRIVIPVDTRTRGDLTFFVALDGIESDSCISERFCIADFDKMSERLQEEFGVQTKFRTPNHEEHPRLRRKGEKDEPTGASMEAK